MTQSAVRSQVPGILRAAFDRPPINLVNDETAAEVTALADRIESDPGVKVLIIDSTNPDWFMARYDISGQPLVSGANPWSGLERFAEAADRIARAPVLSIASIRGRARGDHPPAVVASAAPERRKKIRERAAALGDAFERDLGRNLGPAPRYRRRAALNNPPPQVRRSA